MGRIRKSCGLVERLMVVNTLIAVLTASAAVGGSVAEEVGLNALSHRIGANNMPTGSGVIVGQVEAVFGGYGPDQSLPEFAGKTFIPMSGSPGSSGHATTVAQYMYGTLVSLSPGVSTIHLWTATNWVLSGYLQTDQPFTTPIGPHPDGLKIFNNSWVGSLGFANTDTTALRRADRAVNTLDVLIVNGVNNEQSSTNFALMSHMYNGIAVGVTNGNHNSAATLGTIDGPGRRKPEIVAPGGATSFAAPLIAGAGALLVETARTQPGLSSNPFAQRTEVIKAVLMAGTSRRSTWTNNAPTSGPDRGVTSQPIDAVFGADELDINTSHRILTTGEQNGTVTVPAAPNALRAGWDMTEVGHGESRYHRFRIGAAGDASILLTWHRRVRVLLTAWDVADFSLTLWRVNEAGQLATLVGKGGMPYFASGNVVSNSDVDNVEHLFVRNLQPGQYVLEVKRLDTNPANPTWEAAVAWILPAKPGDLNGDGVVGPADLGALLGSWGPCGPVNGCANDLNGDGAVGPADLGILLGNWG